MEMPSSCEIYQRVQQSRDEMQDMIIKSVSDVSDRHIMMLYFLCMAQDF